MKNLWNQMLMKLYFLAISFLKKGVVEDPKISMEKRHNQTMDRIHCLEKDNGALFNTIVRTNHCLEAALAEWNSVNAKWKQLDQQLIINARVINLKFCDIDNNINRMDGAHILLKRQVDSVMKTISDSAESICTSPVPLPLAPLPLAPLPPAPLPPAPIKGGYVRTAELRKKISVGVIAFHLRKKAAKEELLLLRKKNTSIRMKAWHLRKKQEKLRQADCLAING